MTNRRLPGDEPAGHTLALRRAWESAIAQLRPTHFATLTTRVPVALPRLERAALLWLRSIAKGQRSHFPACSAIDLQAREALHVHLALRAPGLDRANAERSWRESDPLAWNALVLDYDPEQRGAEYMARHPLRELLLVCPRTGRCRRSSCVEPTPW